MADFVPSAPFEATRAQIDSETLDDANAKNKNYQRYVAGIETIVNMVKSVNVALAMRMEHILVLCLKQPKKMLVVWQGDFLIS